MRRPQQSGRVKAQAQRPQAEQTYRTREEPEARVAGAEGAGPAGCLGRGFARGNTMGFFKAIAAPGEAIPGRSGRRQGEHLEASMSIQEREAGLVDRQEASQGETRNGEEADSQGAQKGKAAVKRPSVPWGRKAPGTEHNGVSHCAYTVPEAMTDTTEERRVHRREGRHCGGLCPWKTVHQMTHAMSSLDAELEL